MATTIERQILPELEGEFELEGEGEWEWEMEGEGEWELEGEMESEEFFGWIADLAGRAGTALGRRAVPVLQRISRQAAQSVESTVDGARSRLGIPQSRGFLGTVNDAYRRYQAAQRSQQQELETEWEGEWEAAPPTPVSPLATRALMEHLGHAATQAESEEEAEAFIGALIPLAAQILPRVAPAVMRAAPQLLRGAANMVRTLRSNPATRQLVRTVPSIVGRTVQSLGSQIAQGRPITAQGAVRTLSRQTQRVLGSPQQAVQAYRRSRALDRRYHGQARAAAGAPSPAGLQQPTCQCGGGGMPAAAPDNPEGYF